jgi:hypothetical protein
MNPPPRHTSIRLVLGLLLMFAAMGMVVVVFLVSQNQVPPLKHQPVIQTLLPVAANSPPEPAATTPAASSTVLANGPDFKERPLRVAYESPNFQWTLEDGKDTNIIRQLAHNPLEYQRMVDENPRIFRRELVYLKETAASVFEEAKLTGQPVQQLTLPGADGRELQFAIVQSEGNGSSRQGTFYGHLAGNLDSQVSLAFMDGREAFTVLSPKDNIYVVGEPREPGQVIVKAIDPNTYGMGPAEQQGDDFIKTGEPVQR